AEPEDDRGEREFGAVVGGSFGVAGGQGTELLEPVEAPFHDVTTLVDLRVEHRWAPAAMALTEPVGGVVLLLRAGERDATAAQGPAGGGAGVGLVRQDPVRTLPGPAGPVALDADLVQQRQQLRVVPGLPGREDHAHRQPAAVGRKVDLGRQASPRPAERLTGDRELVDPP